MNLTVLAFVNHSMRFNLTVQAHDKWYKTDFYLTVASSLFRVIVASFLRQFFAKVGITANESIMGSSKSLSTIMVTSKYENHTRT